MFLLILKGVLSLGSAWASIRIVKGRYGLKIPASRWFSSGKKIIHKKGCYEEFAEGLADLLARS